MLCAALLGCTSGTERGEGLRLTGGDAAGTLALPGVTLDGGPPAPWPLEVPESAGRYLVPFRGADGLVRARLVDGEDARTVELGVGAYLGACAHAGGFAVALASADRVNVQFLDGAGQGTAVAVALDGADGAPQAGLASDGERVAFLSRRTDGEAFLHFARASANANANANANASASAIPLGRIELAAALFGDSAGFVVGPRLLVGGTGALSRAPGDRVDGARLFQRALLDGSAVTLDGDRWLTLTGPVRLAARDPAGALLLAVLPDDAPESLVHVGPDLTPSGSLALDPESPPDTRFVRALSPGRALVESASGSDRLFAILDPLTGSPAGPLVRIPEPASFTVVGALSARDALVIWLDGEGKLHYARW